MRLRRVGSVADDPYPLRDAARYPNPQLALGAKVVRAQCAACHTLRGANAVGKVGPNLDQLRPTKALVLGAVALGRVRGAGTMPAQLVRGQDAQDVADFVSAVAGRD